MIDAVLGSGSLQAFSQERKLNLRMDFFVDETGAPWYKAGVIVSKGKIANIKARLRADMGNKLETSIKGVKEKFSSRNVAFVNSIISKCLDFDGPQIGGHNLHIRDPYKGTSRTTMKKVI